MTNDEIIRAAEICFELQEGNGCDMCPYESRENCYRDFREDVLTLLKCQKEEIISLRDCQKEMQRIISCKNDELKKIKTNLATKVVIDEEEIYRICKEYVYQTLKTTRRRRRKIL